MVRRMDPVIHFEIPVKNGDRVRRFYETAFGWQTAGLGPEAGNFILAYTTETDEDRTPKKAGAINGGFYEKTGSEEQVRLTILVDDIRETMRMIQQAGGRVIEKEPFELPGVGLFASFMDTEENLLTVYEDLVNSAKK